MKKKERKIIIRQRFILLLNFQRGLQAELVWIPLKGVFLRVQKTWVPLYKETGACGNRGGFVPRENREMGSMLRRVITHWKRGFSEDSKGFLMVFGEIQTSLNDEN